MNVHLKKFIAGQQVIIFMITAIFFLLFSLPEEVKAVEYGQWNSIVHTEVYSLVGSFVKEDIGRFSIYVTTGVKNVGSASYDGNCVYIDEGVPVHLVPIDSSSRSQVREFNEDNFKIDIYRPNGSSVDGISCDNCMSGVSFNSDVTGTDFFIYIRRKRAITGLDGMDKALKIRVILRKNSISLPSTPNAAMKSGVIYIRPGASANLSTQWESTARGMGTYSLEDNQGFGINGNVLMAPSTLNKSVTVKWESRFGTVCRVRAVTSSLATNTSPAYNIRNGNVQNITTVCQGYTTSKKIGLPIDGRESTVVLQQLKYFRNVNVGAVAGGLTVEDVTRCLSGVNVVANNTAFEIRFKARAEGVIKVNWYDYANVIHSEYWRVMPLNNATVETPPPQVADVGVEESSTEVPDNNIPVVYVDDSNYDNGIVGSPSQGNPSGSQEQQPQLAYPSINTARSQNGNVIRIEGGISNSTELAYALIKCDYLGQNHSTFDTYSQFIAYAGGRVQYSSNPGYFSYAINTLDYEDGEYFLYISAKNTNNDVWAGEVWTLTLGPSVSRPAPKIELAEQVVTDKLTCRFNIQYASQVSYALIEDRDGAAFNKQFNTLEEYFNYVGSARRDVQNPSNFIFVSDNMRTYHNTNYVLFVQTYDAQSDWWNVSWWNFQLGEKFGLRDPYFVFGKITNNEDKTRYTIPVEAGYCTEFKYKFVTKDELYGVEKESSLGYDAFSGTVVKSQGAPKDLTLTYNSKNMKSGDYFLVVFGINQQKNIKYIEKHYIGKLNGYPVEIAFDSGKTEDIRTERKINIRCFNYSGTKNKIWYYVKKFDNMDKYSIPSVEEIKKQGKAATAQEISNKTIELDLKSTELGSGYYDIFVYAENAEGDKLLKSYKGVMNSIIQLSNTPNVEFYIKKKDQKSTMISNNLHYVEVSVNEEAYRDYFDLKFFTTDKDLTNGGKNPLTVNMFNSNDDYRVYTIKVDDGDEFSIPVVSSNGKTGNMYMYMYAKDKFGACSKLLRTGSIYVDASELALERISADKGQSLVGATGNGEIAKLGYGVGQSMKVTMQFNHTMSNKDIPDLYLKFGNGNKRKQNSATVKENEIIYEYNITDADSSGDITIDSYDGVFKDNYGMPNTYNKTINTDNTIIDELTNRYYVDTTPLKIDSVEIAVTTRSTEGTIEDTENNAEYISSYEKVEARVNYNKLISGTAPTIKLVKGNKRDIVADSKYSKRINNAGKTTDVYDVTELIKTQDDNLAGNAEGELLLNSIFEATYTDTTKVTDGAGNIISKDAEYNVKYILNGQDLGDRKLIIDNKVQEPQIYVKGEYRNTRAASEGVFPKETEFVCFAEASNESNFKDLAGIDGIQLAVTHENDSYTVKDKSGNDVTGVTKGNTTTYQLEEEQLPISVKINSTGNFGLGLYKDDNLGNYATNTALVKISDEVMINKELSKFKNLNSDSYYNAYSLTKEQTEYNVYIKLGELNKDDIQVVDSDGRAGEVELEYVNEVQDAQSGDMYAVYKYNVSRGGRHTIQVRNLEGEVIYMDFLDINNVFIVGDTNGDGHVSLFDAIPILRYIAFFSDSRTEYIKHAGDVDGSGDVDVSDAVLLQRFLVEDADVRRTNEGYLYSVN